MNIENIINKASAAVRTLKSLKYTYHGAEYWKPPLAPLIELIDGNAYQFINIEENNINGIYNEDEHLFQSLNVEWPASTCTNIKLLEVKS